MSGVKRGDAFCEGNPFVGRTLQTHPKLQDVDRLSVFLSPLSREEILFLRDQARVLLPDLVADVMRRKLVWRAQRQKTYLSLKDLEEIERRAGSAYRSADNRASRCAQSATDERALFTSRQRIPGTARN